MEPWAYVIGFIIAAVLVALLVFAIYQRVKFRRELKARGWTFEGNPPESILIGLNNPPFGIGLKRDALRRIVGSAKTIQVPFQTFKYSCSEWSSGNKHVVTMPLKKSFPAFYSIPAELKFPNIPGFELSDGSWIEVADDVSFGGTVKSLIGGHLAQLNQIAPMGVTIDHSNLVVIGSPGDLETLDKVVEIMASMVQAINSSSSLEQYNGRPVPDRLTFHRHPYWSYIQRDDSFLYRVEHTTAGYDHEAREIITNPNGPLPFIALSHHWKEDYTYTDSDGDTQTRTENKDEVIFEFHLKFPFVPFSMNRRTGKFEQKLVQFEYADFNKKFKVRCENAKFAMDVFHPRTLDYIMKTSPPPFYISSDLALHFSVKNYSEDIAGWCESFLTGFFGRIPDFVWEDLGTARPIEKPDVLARQAGMEPDIGTMPKP